MEKVRICGEITPGHELSFLFIKGRSAVRITAMRWSL